MLLLLWAFSMTPMGIWVIKCLSHLHILQLNLLLKCFLLIVRVSEEETTTFFVSISLLAVIIRWNDIVLEWGAPIIIGLYVTIWDLELRGFILETIVYSELLVLVASDSNVLGRLIQIILLLLLLLLHEKHSYIILATPVSI